MRLLKKLFANGGIPALLLTVFAALGCSIGFGDQPAAKPSTDKRSSALSTDDASAIKKATTTSSKKSNAASENADNGDFVPVYAQIQNEKYAAFDERFKQQKVVEGITDALNQSFALPADVPITFRDCGVANAWYQPQTKTITFCYEFMDLFYSKAIEMGKSEDEANRIMIGATLFFFFHELGHCLVDVYELPATGREEDAVDQLSMLILMEAMDEDGQYSAASGAIIFKALAENEETSERTFSNEHSLNSQRFYNLVCWMYGKDPNQFGSLVQDGTLPEQRAGRCSEEYQKMSKAWEKLITPWIKK